MFLYAITEHEHDR